MDRRYARHKERAAARQRQQSSEGREIAPLPDVGDSARRGAAVASFRVFAETYFSAAFCLAWSQAHLKAIERIERAVVHGELYALAMPRASGKTTLTTIACIWAVLTGRHRMVAMIAANAGKAKQLLKAVKIHLRGNELLRADFPEVCYPIHKLGNVNQRSPGQTYNGQPTMMEYTATMLVLPTIPGSVASGATILCAGMEGGDIRGAHRPLESGEIMRPSLVLIDDPQTRKSARSDMQNQTREAILAGDVLMMAGPGRKIAGLMGCTVIVRGDMADRILDRKLHPEWQGERTAMLTRFPDDMKLWDEYGERRAAELANDGDGSLATEFYRAHREEMDRGALPSWPARYNADELSAVQHAMNLYYRDRAAFFAECQNAPLDDHRDEELLDADAIARQLNGAPRGAAPLECAKLTAFIDVHKKLLFWMVCGWSDRFDGHVLDYGVWPEQRVKNFTLANATRSLRQAYRKAGDDGAILAGVKDLTAALAGRQFLRADGGHMAIGRIGIDTGYKDDLVYAAMQACPHRGLIVPTKGLGIGAKKKPLSQYVRKPGEQIGHHWLVGRAGAKGQLLMQIGTYYWKSRVHAALATAAGDRGCLQLFGRDPSEHRLLAAHLTAEFRVPVTANGRTVDEWSQRPGAPDNHWFDCLVGCAALASREGLRVVDAEGEQPRPKVASFVPMFD